MDSSAQSLGVTKNQLVEAINNQIRRMDSFFLSESAEEFHLALDDKHVRFPKADAAQKRWFRNWTQCHSLHEPGMVATLWVLSRLISQRVVFYDLGALYGYFGVIAKELFNDAGVFCIEANPTAFNSLANSLTRYGVTSKNLVVSNYSGSFYYLIRGYSIFRFNTAGALLKLADAVLRNILKLFLRVLLNRKYVLTKVRIQRIESKTILDIASNKSEVIIIKSDLEGYQSVCISPFIEQIASRGMIVLMELDDGKKMLEYDGSNIEILRNFAKAGYSIIWMNHRISGEARLIEEFASEIETNSMALLIPSVFLESTN